MVGVANGNSNVNVSREAQKEMDLNAAASPVHVMVADQTNVTSIAHVS